MKHIKNISIFLLILLVVLAIGFYVQTDKLDRNDKVALDCSKNGISNRDTDYALNIRFNVKKATLVFLEYSDDEVQSFYDVSQTDDGYYFDFQTSNPPPIFRLNEEAKKLYQNFELSKDLKYMSPDYECKDRYSGT